MGKTDQNANMLLSITGYKLDFYKTDKTQTKSTDAYEEEVLDDLAIIEVIIQRTMECGGPFYFGRMCRPILVYLETRFKKEGKTMIDGFPPQDAKEGLRALLFLMLQVCIAYKGVSFQDDFGALWTTYAKLLHNMQHSNFYHDLVHNVFYLSVAFQRDCVSDWIKGKYIWIPIDIL